MYELYGDMTDKDLQEDLYLTFILGDESYGIEVRHVTEIIGMQPITPIPELPAYMKGIINLRGAIIPLMDVRLRFGMPERAYDARTCIIVTHIRDVGVGLIVDGVSEVVTIGGDAISDAPEMNRRAGGRYISRIGATTGGIRLLLDCDELMRQDETERLEDSVEGETANEMV